MTEAPAGINQARGFFLEAQSDPLSTLSMVQRPRNMVWATAAFRTVGGRKVGCGARLEVTPVTSLHIPGQDSALGCIPSCRGGRETQCSAGWPEETQEFCHQGRGGVWVSGDGEQPSPPVSCGTGVHFSGFLWR